MTESPCHVTVNRPGKFTFGCRCVSAAILTVFAATAVAEPDMNMEMVEINLESSVRFIDNFYYQRDVKQTNSGLIVAPSLKMMRVSERFKLDLGAKAEAAAFGTGNRDNYTDATATGMFGMVLPREQLLQLRGTFKLGHDQFGTQRTEGTQTANADLDKWEQATAKLSYSVGEQLATKFGLQLSYQIRGREYTTNRGATLGLDRRSYTPEATILFHLSPKFSLLATARQIETKFDVVTPGGINRSGSSQSLFAGAKWDATAKTSGELRVGASRWEPDDPNFSDTDISSWAASIDWNPTQRTGFVISTERRFLPSYREDTQFIDDQSGSVAWRQLWTRNVNTNVALRLGNRDLVGSGNDHNLLAFSSRINWSLDRGLKVYAVAILTERDAVARNEDFERSSVTVGFSANLN